MTDWKKVGLSAKDMLVGLVTVVAGAEAGSAGAQGAQQLGKGLDSILDSQGIKEEAPPSKEPPNASRIEPSRADFQARRDTRATSSPAAAANVRAMESLLKAAQQKQGPPSRVVVLTAKRPPEQEPVFREAVLLPDERVPATKQLPPARMSPELVEELARRGFSETEIAQLEAGTASGTKPSGAEGIRLAESRGNPKQSAQADADGAYEGFPVTHVAGQVLRRTDREG
jgi:soluble lytic murein transglycosylase-like protein